MLWSSTTEQGKRDSRQVSAVVVEVLSEELGDAASALEGIGTRRGLEAGTDGSPFPFAALINPSILRHGTESKSRAGAVACVCSVPASPAAWSTGRATDNDVTPWWHAEGWPVSEGSAEEEPP